MFVHFFFIFPVTDRDKFTVNSVHFDTIGYVSTFRNGLFPLVTICFDFFFLG